MIDLKDIELFLGTKVTRSGNIIIIYQIAYVKTILINFKCLAVFC